MTGATTPELSIFPVERSDEGGYDVVVTDGDGASTTSAVGILTVGSAPGSPGASLRVTRTDATVELAWVAGDGATSHVVQRCDATADPCTPSDVATAPATSHSEPLPAGTAWSIVLARNGCGRTD